MQIWVDPNKFHWLIRIPRTVLIRIRQTKFWYEGTDLLHWSWSIFTAVIIICCTVFIRFRSTALILIRFTALIHIRSMPWSRSCLFPIPLNCLDRIRFIVLIKIRSTWSGSSQCPDLDPLHIFLIHVRCSCPQICIMNYFSVNKLSKLLCGQPSYPTGIKNTICICLKTKLFSKITWSFSKKYMHFCWWHNFNWLYLFEINTKNYNPF